MVKTIKINDEKEITLSNNLTWAMIYKSQFGHDILPDIMPIFSALTKMLNEISKVSGQDIGDALKLIDSDALQDAMIEMCALQFTDFINLTWALAKANDDTIEPPYQWASQFDEFPLDLIGPAVFELLAKGLVSSKNLTSLRKTTKAKKSTQK